MEFKTTDVRDSKGYVTHYLAHIEQDIKGTMRVSRKLKKRGIEHVERKV